MTVRPETARRATVPRPRMTASSQRWTASWPPATASTRAPTELTGARRRGIGLEELGNEMERARRESDGSLVAAFVDVDGLKSVNDMEGHAAGDALLRAVADGLRRHTRSYDLFVRLGGDEFLCALPNVTLVEARARFDRLRTDLAGSGSSVGIGCTELRDGDSADDLVDTGTFARILGPSVPLKAAGHLALARRSASLSDWHRTRPSDPSTPAQRHTSSPPAAYSPPT